MPHLRFRGMPKEELLSLSKAILDELEQIIGSPRDHFTLEYIHSDFIMDGKIASGYPFVEMLWFNRGQVVQDQVARSLTKLIKPKGYEDVCVIFTSLQEDKYYENGEHF